MKKLPSETLCLIQDIVTRWNSTYSMGARILLLRPALEHLLIDYPVKDIYFTSRDWELLEQVVTVLKVFWDITLELSKGGTCISITIPCVSIILNQLKLDKRADRGIIGWKSAISDEMIRMFGPKQVDDRAKVGGLDIETKHIYRLATVLDPQFKNRFFTDRSNGEEAVEVLTDKLVEQAMLMADKEKENLGETSKRSIESDDEEELTPFERMKKKFIKDNRQPQPVQSHSSGRVREQAERVIQQYILEEI